MRREFHSSLVGKADSTCVIGPAERLHGGTHKACKQPAPPLQLPWLFRPVQLLLIVPPMFDGQAAHEPNECCQIVRIGKRRRLCILQLLQAEQSKTSKHRGVTLRMYGMQRQLNRILLCSETKQDLHRIFCNEEAALLWRSFELQQVSLNTLGTQSCKLHLIGAQAVEREALGRNDIVFFTGPKDPGAVGGRSGQVMHHCSVRDRLAEVLVDPNVHVANTSHWNPLQLGDLAADPVLAHQSNRDGAKATTRVLDRVKIPPEQEGLQVGER
mmetsp:Transcript_18153/g.45687  ORF Transcript_18153/g.45687 Transcript_18153/m.45687 type:complete len:270 (-) Transcript_18153:246-1055(-)